MVLGEIQVVQLEDMVVHDVFISSEIYVVCMFRVCMKKYNFPLKVSINFFLKNTVETFDGKER